MTPHPHTDPLLDLAPIRAEAVAIAREAAAILSAGWRTGVSIRSKGRSDLVTEIDLASERLVRERLGARFPDHAIVGEEGGGEASTELVWYVDPLDGTTNFAHGHPFFCVSIALARAGEPIVGAVVAPALGLEWSAAKGLGVTRNGEACSVSATDTLEDALLSTGFPSWRGARGDNNYLTFLALDAASHGARRCGAGAVELALVADGSYDAFWDLGLKPWDVAASSLFVREAGGVVSDFDGSAARLDAGRIIASNGRIHAELMGGIAGAIPLPPLDPGTRGSLPSASGVR